MNETRFLLSDREREFYLLCTMPQAEILTYSYEMRFEDIPPYCIIEAIRIFLHFNEGARIRLAPEEAGKEPMQEILPVSEIPLEVTSCDGTDSAYQEVVQRYINRPLDPWKYTIRFQAVLFPKEETRLLIAFHHLNMDYYCEEHTIASIRKIANELRNTGRTAYEAPSFTGFLEWRRAYLKGTEFQRDMEFWSEYLSGNYEIGRMNGEGRRMYENQTFWMTNEEQERLSIAARRVKISTVNVLYVLYGLVLSEYTGLRRFTIQRSYSNRFGQYREVFGILRSDVLLIFDADSFTGACERWKRDGLRIASHARITKSRIQQIFARNSRKLGKEYDPLDLTDFYFNEHLPEIGARRLSRNMSEEMRKGYLKCTVIKKDERTGLVIEGNQNLLRDASQGGAPRSFEDVYRRMMELMQ